KRSSRFGSADRVEGEPRTVAEVLASARIPDRAWRDQGEDALGQCERLRADGAQKSVQRAALLGGGNTLRYLLAIPANGVGVEESPKHLGSGLCLITVYEVNRYQHVFEAAHRSAHTDDIRREPAQCAAANFHHAVQLIDRVRAGVPQVGRRMRA